MSTSGSGSAVAAVSSGYPTADDLQTYLEGHGMTLSAALEAQLERAISGARQDLENATGRVFLAVEGTRTFDPPVNASGVLDLGEDLVSLTSLSLSGSALTEGSDFRLERLNGAARGLPYGMVCFNQRWCRPLAASLWNAVEIGGLWGYSETVPADVWEAILARGASRLFTHIAHGNTGGLLAWKEKDRGEEYGVETWKRLKDGWQDVYTAAVSQYKRVATGL